MTHVSEILKLNKSYDSPEYPVRIFTAYWNLVTAGIFLFWDVEALKDRRNRQPHLRCIVDQFIILTKSRQRAHRFWGHVPPRTSSVRSEYLSLLTMVEGQLLVCAQELTFDQIHIRGCGDHMQARSRLKAKTDLDWRLTVRDSTMDRCTFAYIDSSSWCWSRTSSI